jgi:hypothetical protein
MQTRLACKVGQETWPLMSQPHFTFLSASRLDCCLHIFVSRWSGCIDFSFAAVKELLLPKCLFNWNLRQNTIVYQIKLNRTYISCIEVHPLVRQHNTGFFSQLATFMSNSTENICIHLIYLYITPVFPTSKASLWDVETKYFCKWNTIYNTWFRILGVMASTCPGIFDA